LGLTDAYAFAEPDAIDAASREAALATATARGHARRDRHARSRAAGLVVDHDLERCRRTGSTLVVTFVDVVGLGSFSSIARALAA